MTRTIPRKYLRFSGPLPVLPVWQRCIHYIRGVILFPFYWIAAGVLGTPGMGFRWRCFGLGLRLLAIVNVAEAYRCIVSPLDSVRHFEFDFFWRRTFRSGAKTLLDVSSPRLLPLMLLRAQPDLSADVINPDANDLRRTVELAEAIGVSKRCRFDSLRIEELAQLQRSFDLITCMSVLEHIVDDEGAIRVMWSLLTPGGRLLVSVPCAASAYEEHSNVDEYHLLESDAEGFVFWQRFYDRAMLERIFAITGPPASQAIFGERKAGNYDADVVAKRTDPRYPRWREPYATTRAYAYRDILDDLPGMGVIAMEFVKPATTIAATAGTN